MNVTRQIDPGEEPKLAELTLNDFRTLHEAGAFDNRRKIELIEGVLFERAPQLIPHARFKFRLAMHLANALTELGSLLEVLVEATVAMPSKSAPQPDITLAGEQCGKGYVEVSTVALLVEVASTTYRLDSGDKAALYALNGIPEYWIADLQRERIEQFWTPISGEYTQRRSVRLGERIESATLSALALDTRGLL